MILIDVDTIEIYDVYKSFILLDFFHKLNYPLFHVNESLNYFYVLYL